jgi:hypothetical protein
VAFQAFVGLLGAWPWTQIKDQAAVGPTMNRRRLLRELEASADYQQAFVQPKLAAVPDQPQA